MNREIKFRAWDKENKIMSDPLPLTWFITGEPRDMQFPKTEESLPLNDFREYLSDFIFNQFTGLKDKNGKEVYEGDIIKIESGKIGEVVFDNGCFYTPIEESNYRLGGWKTESVFVLGNIYETPELQK